MINFPLWKAAAIGQSGFKEAADFYGRMRLIFGPPYKGVAATIFGMTWARAAIFYGSDVGKEHLLQNGWSPPLASTLPPIGISAFVQVANQPIVRATIQLQDPSSTQPNVLAQLMELFRKRGWRALYHGSSASVLKTVPKYVCAIWVKDWVALKLPPPTAPVGHPEHKQQVLCRAAAKSIAAGVAGAALTNPLDVIRNEMFKYEVRSMCRRSVAARADPHPRAHHFFRVSPAHALSRVVADVLAGIFQRDVQPAAAHRGVGLLHARDATQPRRRRRPDWHDHLPDGGAHRNAQKQAGLTEALRPGQRRQAGFHLKKSPQADARLRAAIRREAAAH